MSEQPSEQLTRLMNMLEDFHEKAVYGGVQNTFARTIGKHKIDICLMYSELEAALAAAEQEVGELRALVEDAIETLEITAEVGYSAKAISEKADELRAALNRLEE